MKGKFDLIVFDWDGTLMDSVDWIVQCLIVAAKEQGCIVPVEQDIRDIIGLSIHKSLDRLFPTLDKPARKDFIESYSRAFFSRKITEQDLFDGVVDVLQKFKEAGYLLAVATGKSRYGLDKAIQGTGIEHFFDVTKCADETASKPKPDMLNEIIKEMAVSKERVIMIGDSVHDMEMAANAGVASIAVLCGANSLKQMAIFSPLQSLQQTKELLQIL